MPEPHPWLTHSEWSDGTVGSEGHKALFTHWIGAIIWNGLSVPILVLLIRDGWSAHPPFIAVVLTGFVILGVMILVNAVVYSLRIVRFRTLRLTLDPFPGCIGGQAGGSVELPIRPGSELKGRATLHCIRSYMRGSGENRSRRDAVVWSAQVVPELERSASGSRMRFVFDVPDVEQPESEARDGDHHYWSVHIAAELPGADLDQSFVVPLYRVEPPLQASRPFHPPRADARELSEHGIDVEPTARGLRIEYRRGRYGMAPYALIPFGVLCIASGSFIFSQTAGSLTGFGALFTAFGGLFLVVFGLVGLLLLVLGFDMLLSRLTVEIGGGTIHSTRSYLGFSSTKEAAIDDVDAIDAKVTMQSGQGSGAKTGYTLIGRLAGGGRITLGDGIRGAFVLDRLRTVLEEEMGVPLKTEIRRRLGAG